jgi:hypothetical protein
MRASISATYSTDPQRNTSIYNPVEIFYPDYDFSSYVSDGLLSKEEASSLTSLKFDVRYSSMAFINIDINGNQFSDSCYTL